MEATSRRFFLFLLVGATLLLALVLRPLANALILACVLAGVLWPLQQRLARALRKSRNAAAGLLVLGVVLLLVGPLAALSAIAVKEASDGFTFVSETLRSEGVSGLLEKLPPSARDLAKSALKQLPTVPGQSMEETVQQQVSAQQGAAASAAGNIMVATGSFIFDAVMALIALFFLLVHGHECVAFLDHASPLRKGETLEILGEFKSVSVSVVASTLITSGVQAIAALIGYLITGVPRPLFFAGVTFFVAFIPAIGAGTACVAAAGFLFLTGHPYLAAFLAVWGFFVVGFVDNLVKPLLIKRGLNMNGAVVFFALIGGLAAFGPIGLLLGPLVFSLFLALLRIYKRDYAPTAVAR